MTHIDVDKILTNVDLFLGSIHTESLGPFNKLSRGKKVYRSNMRMIYGGSGHADGVTLL